MVRVASLRKQNLCPDYLKGDVHLREISFPENLSGLHSEAKERLGAKTTQKALQTCGRPTVHTFQAMKYGSCFDTLVIAWMFTFLVSMGFMVHKV